MGLSTSIIMVPLVCHLETIFKDEQILMQFTVLQYVTMNKIRTKMRCWHPGFFTGTKSVPAELPNPCPSKSVLFLQGFP